MGPHAPGEIGATRHGPFPLTDDRLEERLVAGLHRHIHGGRRQVERPDRVTGERDLVPHRDVVLEVRPPPVDVGEGLMSAAIDEQRCLVEIALLARYPRQLDQAELDLRMAADPLDAPVTEDFADVVGDPLRHFHEFVGPAGPCSGDGGLEHVPVAIQLVTPLQVAVSIGLAGTTEDRVEVAIFLLDRGDDSGEFGEAPIRVGRARSTDLPGGRLHQLVHVGVSEDHTIAVLR